MKKIYAFLLSLIMYSAFGQDGTLEPSTVFNYGSTSSAKKICKDSAGNYIVLTENNNIVKMEPGGNVLFTITLPAGNYNVIYGQSNGGILVSGDFVNYNYLGQTYNWILRYTSTGAFDPNFKCNFLPSGYARFAPAVISEQPTVTNRLLIGGRKTVSGTGIKLLYRIDSNTGLVDTTFNAFPLESDLQAGMHVSTISTYSNGSMIVGGEFSTYNGASAGNVIKLNANGGHDTSYGVTGITVSSSAILSSIIQPDGKILLGGSFTHTPTGKKGLIRTSSTGIVETGFGLNFNPAPVVKDIKIECNLNILICGEFDKGIIRLNNNGDLDGNFNNNIGADTSNINSMAVSGSTGIYIAGNFTEYNSTPTPTSIARLKGAQINNIVVTNDVFNVVQNGSANIKNILSTASYNGNPATIANVNITASLNNPVITGIDFNLNTGIITVNPVTQAGTYTFTYTLCPKVGCGVCKTATITVIVGPPLLKLVANSDTFITACIDGVAGGFGGNVTTNDTMDSGPIDFNKVTVSITNNGGMQNVSVSATGVLSIPANTPSGIYTVTYQICQKNTVNCATAIVTICVNNGFNPGTGANNTIHAIVLQPNGKIIIGGEFTEYDGKQRNRIARLNFDLSLDETFDPTGKGFNGTVYALALVDNNILVGGAFTGTGGTIQKAKHLLARLDSNGNVDDTFTNNTFSQLSTNPEGAAVYSIVVHPLSDIYIGGSFDKIFGYTNKAKISKLNSNGTVASAFTSPFVEGWGTAKNITLISTSISSLNPGIYVGGRELKLPGSLAEQTSVILCKINTTGTIDTNFALGKAPQSLPYEISSMAYTATTGFIVTGGFDNYNGASMRNIAKIDRTNGSAITSFNPGSSTGDFFERIHAVAIDNTTNKIIIGGIFTKFNTNPAKKIARLNSDGSFDASFNTGNGTPGTGLEHGILKIEGYGVNALKIQADGRIVVGGRFLTFNGMQAKYITRLSQDTPVIQGRKNMYTEENVSKGISIYPNPSEGVFNIDFRGYDENTFDITIYNALGQLIHKGSVTPQNTNQIDLTSFGAGSYFITLQNANETINKIVVKK